MHPRWTAAVAIPVITVLAVAARRRIVLRHLVPNAIGVIVVNAKRRDGTRRLYRARPEGLAGLQKFLDDMWGRSLDLARRLVEAERGISDDTGAADVG